MAELNFSKLLGFKHLDTTARGLDLALDLAKATGAHFSKAGGETLTGPATVLAREDGAFPSPRS